MKGVSSRMAVFLFCLLTISGCNGDTKDALVEARLETLDRIENESSLSSKDLSLTKEADDFELLSDKTPFIFSIERKNNDCYALIKGAIRAKKGNNCIPGHKNQMVAEIGGYSNRCVSGCDTKARLKEANDAAAAKCATYCAQKKCAAQYAPRKKCNFNSCVAGVKKCTKEWPMFDECYLLGPNSVWNCKCVPDVEG